MTKSSQVVFLAQMLSNSECSDHRATLLTRGKHRERLVVLQRCQVITFSSRRLLRYLK